jgi:hypothetical protein
MSRQFAAAGLYPSWQNGSAENKENQKIRVLEA